MKEKLTKFLGSMMSPVGVTSPMLRDFLYKEAELEHECEDFGYIRSAHENALMSTYLREDCERIRKSTAEKAERAASGERSIVKLYPSSVGKCPRYNWLRLIEAPDDAPSGDPTGIAKQQRIFATGNLIGYWYAALFERMGILVERERVVKIEALGMSGRIDDLIEVADEWSAKIVGKRGDYSVEFKLIGPRRRHIIDTKTAKSTMFKKYKEHGGGDEYSTQLQIYMMQEDADGSLLIMNKDTAEEHEIVYERDPKIFDWVREFARETREAADTLTVVDKPKTAHPDSYPCSFCTKRGICMDGFWLDEFLELLAVRREMEKESADEGEDFTAEYIPEV